MLLEHSFTIPVGVDAAWAVLLDIEQVAPCMPGALVDSIAGDEFTGSVKIRLGPIALTYKGAARFTEKDVTQYRAVIDARGQDTRGNGTAAAVVAATLVPQSPSATRVDITTDLNITGKPAQFGRGVMTDVGGKLIGQFADCLSGKLSGHQAPDTSVHVPDSVGATPTGATPNGSYRWLAGAAVVGTALLGFVLARRGSR